MDIPWRQVASCDVETRSRHGERHRYAAGRDFVVVSRPSDSNGANFELSADIAAAIQAPVVWVHGLYARPRPSREVAAAPRARLGGTGRSRRRRGRGSGTRRYSEGSTQFQADHEADELTGGELAEIATAKAVLDEKAVRLAGVVVANLPADSYHAAVRDQLASLDVTPVALLPHDDSFEKVTVAELAKSIGAEVLYGAEAVKNKRVEEITISTLDVANLLGHLDDKPTNNQLVIVEHPRPIRVAADRASPHRRSTRAARILFSRSQRSRGPRRSRGCS